LDVVREINATLVLVSVGESLRALPGTMEVTKAEAETLSLLEAMGKSVSTTEALLIFRSEQPRFEEAKSSVLPKRATDFLKLWCLGNDEHPYPTKHEKRKLMTHTGLSTIQVRNWFTNMRKRHWFKNAKGIKRRRTEG